MLSRLYRFRQCSEQNFAAFYGEQVWVSKGTELGLHWDMILGMAFSQVHSITYIKQGGLC